MKIQIEAEKEVLDLLVFAANAGIQFLVMKGYVGDSKLDTAEKVTKVIDDMTDQLSKDSKKAKQP